MFRRSMLLSVFLLLGGCLFNISLAPGPQPLKETVIEGNSGPKILLVDISGFISYDEQGGTIGPAEPSMVSRVREELRKASGDGSMARVLLKLNTPGGGVSASDAIYTEIKRFRDEQDIPVYASIVGLGTSGGYYIASAADRIYAQPTSVTGSIGVIAMSLEFSGLMEKIGVGDKTYRSGGLKGMLSPFRPDTEEERRIMQGIIDSMHRRFLEVVHDGRKGTIGMNELRKLADGRPFIAGEALEKGLVDSIGYPEDAVEEMKNSLGIDEVRLVAYHRPGAYRGSVYSNSNISGNTVINLPRDVMDTGVRFMYLWTGH